MVVLFFKKEIILGIGSASVRKHTRGEALLQLVGLVRVLEDQGVQVALAPDLELGQAGLLALLDPGVCNVVRNAFILESLVRLIVVVVVSSTRRRRIVSGDLLEGYSPDASSRRQISMNWKKKETRSAF